MNLLDYYDLYVALRHKKNLSGTRALAVVKEHGIDLRWVDNQTEKICLAAVEQDGNALSYVQIQTEEICLAAIKQNIYALQYVNDNLFNSIIEKMSTTEKLISASKAIRAKAIEEKGKAI